MIPAMNVRQVLAELCGVPTSYINKDVVEDMAAYGKLLFVSEESREMAQASVEQIWEWHGGSDTRSKS